MVELLSDNRINDHFRALESCTRSQELQTIRIAELAKKAEHPPLSVHAMKIEMFLDKGLMLLENTPNWIRIFRRRCRCVLVAQLINKHSKPVEQYLLQADDSDHIPKQQQTIGEVEVQIASARETMDEIHDQLLSGSDLIDTIGRSNQALNTYATRKNHLLGFELTLAAIPWQFRSLYYYAFLQPNPANACGIIDDNEGNLFQHLESLLRQLEDFRDALLAGDGE